MYDIDIAGMNGQVTGTVRVRAFAFGPCFVRVQPKENWDLLNQMTMENNWNSTDDELSWEYQSRTAGKR